MRIPSRLPTKLVIPLLLVSVIGTAAATVLLFTHTFPAVQTVTPALTTNCSTLFNATMPLLGHSGNLTFTCAAGSAALISAFGSSGSAKPTFALGAGYTRLFMWPSAGCATVLGLTQCGFLNNAPQCSSGSSMLLQNGVSVTFPITFTGSISGVPGVITATDFLYCAEYTSASATGLGTFVVNWNQ